MTRLFRIAQLLDVLFRSAQLLDVLFPLFEPIARQIGPHALIAMKRQHNRVFFHEASKSQFGDRERIGGHCDCE